MSLHKSIIRTSEGLPPGWEKGLDPSTGKVFYIDHNTKSTMWDLPQHVKDYIDSMQSQHQQPPPPPAAISISQQSQQPAAAATMHKPSSTQDVNKGGNESLLSAIMPDISALPPPNQVSVVVPSPSQFAPPAEVPISAQPSQIDPFFDEPQQSIQDVTLKIIIILTNAL